MVGYIVGACLIALGLVLFFIDRRHQRDHALKQTAVGRAATAAEALGVIEALKPPEPKVERNAAPAHNRIVTKDGRVLEEVSFENLY